jgi:hypothetical protein
MGDSGCLSIKTKYDGDSNYPQGKNCLVKEVKSSTSQADGTKYAVAGETVTLVLSCATAKQSTPDMPSSSATDTTGKTGKDKNQTDTTSKTGKDKNQTDTTGKTGE